MDLYSVYSFQSGFFYRVQRFGYHCAVEHSDDLSIVTAAPCSIRGMHHRWFTHLPVSGHVTCFRFGAVTNQAACPCERMLFLWDTHLGTPCLDCRCILSSHEVKAFSNWLFPFTVAPAVDERVSFSNILIDTSYDWSSPF